LGRTYTRDIIALSQHVDEFINYDEIEKLRKKEQIQFLKNYSADIFLHVFPRKHIGTLAKEAKVPVRVGTTNRIYHWLSCNELIKLSRKNSDFHEAQLNIKLLSFLNIPTDLPLNEIHHYYGLTNIPLLKEEYKKLINKSTYNVILHPKSKGSAKEWGLGNFEKLISLLPPNKFTIFISGTWQDGRLMQAFLKKNKSVIDITGKLPLDQFISFIGHCDALVAASTGPLHIAAALDKKAIGLFSPKRPIHPGRWMPLGKDSHVLIFDEACDNCAKKQNCDCITRINPQQVVDLLLEKNERV
jgi:heptosyltransferase-3